MNDRSRYRGAEPSGYDVPPFDVSVRSDDPSAWVIEMRGELDIATGPILREHLGSYDGSSSSDRLTVVNGHGPETITIREPSQAVHRFLQLVGMNWLIEAVS